MDCKTEFLGDVNINILWDIIYENVIYNKINISFDALKVLFSNVIHHFDSNEKFQNLIETNKKFIIMINNKIQKEKNTLKEKNNSKELITFNDIQKDRTNLFEKQLIEKQNDFNTLINKKVPNAPIFKDNIDKPIQEMDELIKQTIEKRNLDIMNITTQNNKAKTEDFLKSSNTSIKSENSELKKINIDYLTPLNIPKTQEFNVTDLNVVDIDKKVTWGDQLKESIKDVNDSKFEQKFLSKLKVFEIPKHNERIAEQEINIRNLQNEMTSFSIKLDMILNKLDLLLTKHNIYT